MHSAACVASAGFWPLFEMPMFAPPIETLLGSPLLTPGKRAQAMLSKTFLAVGSPAFAASRAEA